MILQQNCKKKGIPTWYEHHNTFADRETFLYRKMLDSLGFFMFVSKTLMRKDESYARYEIARLHADKQEAGDWHDLIRRLPDELATLFADIHTFSLRHTFQRQN